MKKTLFGSIVSAWLLSICVVFGQKKDTTRIQIPTNISPNANHQSIRNIVPPNPDAAALGKYGDIPVSLYTGTPNINIPLYTINRAVSVPISLSYHASGVKVDEISSMVGLGWVLDAGGVITRTVHGIPDDLTGGLQTTDGRTKFNQYRLNQMNASDKQAYENGVANGSYDTEPDEYYYNFLGRTGKLVFDENGGVLLSRHEKLIVSKQTSGFTITDESGTKYYFTEKETTKPTTYCFDKNISFTAESAWYLSTIEPLNAKSINFSYISRENITYTQGVNQTNRYYISADQNCTDDIQTPCKSVYRASIKQLEKISFDLGEVLFSYEQRADLGTGWYRMSGFEVKSVTNLSVKKYAFTYVYNTVTLGTQPDRYILQKVEDITGGNSADISYRMEYNHFDDLPPRNSNAQDHWGYYNNNTTSTLIPEIPLSRTFTWANREPDSTKSQYGLLTKIIYPTKGNSVFAYEPHDFGYLKATTGMNLVEKTGGVRIKSITHTDSIYTKQIRRYKYRMSDNPARSSGCLVGKPVYHYNFLETKYIADGSGGYITANCSFLVASSSSQSYLGSTQGSHVGYEEVTELMDADTAFNGKTWHKFSSFRDYPDYGNTDVIPFPSATSYDEARGSLKEQKVYRYTNGGFITVKKTVNVYGFTEIADVIGLKLMKSSMEYYVGGSIVNQTFEKDSYQYKKLWTPLLETHEYDYNDDGTNEIHSQQVNQYSSNHLQLVESQTTQSLSNKFDIVRYKYPSDYVVPSGTLDAASQAIKDMQTKNALQSVVESQRILKDNGVEKLQSAILNIYNPTTTTLKESYSYISPNGESTWNNSQIQSGSFQKDSRYLKDVTYDLYDTYGNIQQLTRRGDLVESYVWGYGSSLPILSIKNATYSAIQTALTATVLNNLETSTSLSDSQIKSALTPIWNISNSLSQVFTHKPLVGLSTHIASNQLITSFFYDDYQRLKLIQDNESNKLTEYSYLYALPSKITTKQYRAATTGILLANTGPNFITTHDYFDGLGRPIQQVGEQQSPKGKDIVYSTQTYDKYNRLSKGLTVFPSDTSNGGYVSNGEYLAQSFYGDAAPYTNPFYESSPLNRLRSSFGLGSAWQVAGKKMQYFDESAGTDIKYYTVDGSGNITLNGTYPTNSLYKKRLIDEQGNTSIEIKDLQGRLVQRQQKNGTEWLTTYYINDGLGRVSAILQPEAVALNSSISQGAADWLNGVFFYKYDTRGRLIESHVPNGGFTYSVYDKADRMVLSQDAHQTTLNRWTFQKYDGLSRTILSGELPNNSGRNSLQSQFDSHTTFSETFDSSKPEQLYYSNISFPFSVDSSAVMQVTYFDSYNTWRKNGFQPLNTYYVNATGLQTGIRKRYTQNRKLLTEAFYHDSKNRVTEIQKENILNKVERVENTYRFLGSLSNSTVFYSGQTPSQGSLQYSNSYFYDDVERKTKNTLYVFAITPAVSLNSAVDYLYNEIGQLSTKKIQPNRQYSIAVMGKDTINRPPALSEVNTQDIANKAVIISPGFSAVAYDSTLDIIDTYLAEIDTTHSNGLTDAMQIINYGYHIRGQQNCINCYSKQVRIGNKENDLFSMKLDFENDKRYYDGNISKQTWRNPLTSKNQVYKHFYDGVSRLTKSAYSGGLSGSNYSLDTVRYSLNGNILQLKRHTIDNLSYNYNGNQLLSVGDGGTIDGFKDGNTVGNDYGYWADGSLKFDKNKGIDSIVYHSYLRKVSRVKFANGSSINFYYDGAGTLLKRKLSNGDEWIYRDNLLIKNDNIYQITHDEGRIIYDSTALKWVLEYDYRDHQGNLRLSFRDSLAAPVNGVYAPPVITQITEQDPWGLEIKSLSYQNSVNANNFKFQNQESIVDFGLNVNFFKYRPFDPQIGRGWQIDRLADKYVHNSPYAFSENKVTNHIELDGLEAVKTDQFTGTKLPTTANSDNTSRSTQSVMLAKDKRTYNVNEPIKGGYPNGDLRPASQQNATISQGKTDYTNQYDKAAQTGVEIAGTVELGAGLIKIPSLLKEGTSFIKLTKQVKESASTLKQSGQAPATVAGAMLPNGASAIETSGVIPTSIAPQLENAAAQIGGIGAKNSGNTVGCCSEFRAANSLLLEYPQYGIQDLKITPAIRPRTGQVVPRCDNCGAMFGSTPK
ncbi:MAG: DUF6443 domain-containing protein [Flavobacterium sp.]